LSTARQLRLVLKTTLEGRIEEMERVRMQQQVLERSKFQDMVGASEAMRRVYDAISPGSRHLKWRSPEGFAWPA
jgi:hypothetical protein